MHAYFVSTLRSRFALVCGCLLLAAMLLSPHQVRAQSSSITIGIVADGSWDGNEAAVAVFRNEILSLTQGEFDVVVPEEKVRLGDWTLEGIHKAVQDTYADPDVDIVLALGTNCGAMVCQRPSLSKPTIAPFIVDSAFDNIPFDDGSSGKDNLVYNSTPGTVERDLEKFLEVVSFDTLGVLSGPASLRLKTASESWLVDLGAKLGVQIRLVHVESSVEQALLDLPADVEAIYILPLLSISTQDFLRLVEGVHQRRLPTFSLFGRTEVDMGVLAGVGTDDFIERAARRTALNIQSILLGQNASTLPVAFDRGSRLSINMATARRLGIYPQFSVLTTAELIGEDQTHDRVLSLKEAVEEAVLGNRDLAAQDRVVTAGEYAIRETTSFLLPQIDLSSQATVIDDDRALLSTAEGTWQGGAGLRQSLYSEPLWAQRAIEKHLQEGRIHERQSLRLNIIRDAATSFLQVLRAKTQERLEKENLDVTRSNLELARLRVRVGSSSRSDVLRWQAQVAANRIAVINANAQRNVGEIELNRLLNRPAEESFETQETGVEDVDLMRVHQRLEEYVNDPWSFKLFRNFMVEMALQRSPEIMQLDAVLAAQTRALQSTNRAFWVPDFGLQADWTRMLKQWGSGEDSRSLLGIDDNDWNVGVRGSLPLFEGGGRLATRSRVTEEIVRLRLERQALAQRVEQSLRSSMHSAGAARAAISLSRQAADASIENLDLVTDSYSRGVMDILGLLDAQNAALQAEIKASNAIYDYLIQWMRVERAIGQFVFYVTEEEIEVFFVELEKYFDTARR